MSDGYAHVQTKIATEVELMGSTPQKKGHTCFGCCCDTRRAVIICNVVVICMIVLSISFMVAGIEPVQKVATQTADDDAVKTAGKELSSVPIGLLIVIVILQFVFSCLGVQGALSFTKWQVMCALAWYSFSFVRQLVTFNIFGMIVNGLLAYPHIFFIRELDSQIMSPENYPNEMQSWCCL